MCVLNAIGYPSSNHWRIAMLKPYMPQQEIAIMDALLYIKRPKSVLEFGAGGSTVRWAGRVNLWTAIEASSEWVRKVRRAAPRAEVWFVKEEPWEAYVSPVAYRYDLIFVDGRHRVECVKASPQWLAPGGVIVLHDAMRPEYAEAWDVYPHKLLLGQGNAIQNGLLLMWGDS